MHALLYAMVGGFEVHLRWAVFYRALAMGAMGLTAALTGLLTAFGSGRLFTHLRRNAQPADAAGLAAGTGGHLAHHTCAGQRRSGLTPAALLLGAWREWVAPQLILFKLAAEPARFGP